MTDDGEAPSETDQWSRIQMTEPGEVNGVRFLPGTIIDAQSQDADKLIHSGKAVRVDMDGNIIDHHDDDFNDSDNPANDSDDTAQAIDDDASAQTLYQMMIASDEPRGLEMMRRCLMLPLKSIDAEGDANDDQSQMADTRMKTQKHQPHDAQTAELIFLFWYLRRWSDSLPDRTFPS